MGCRNNRFNFSKDFREIEEKPVKFGVVCEKLGIEKFIAQLLLVLDK